MGLPASTIIFLILSTFVLFSTATVDHGCTNVSPFCMNATTAPDDKHICTQLVNGAKTWPEAMTNAVKGVIGIAKSAKPLVVDGVESKLPLALNLQAKESITSGCRDLFLTYVNILEKCIEFVKHDPFSSLETYLSGNTFFDCNDGLDEFQVCIPEVNNFYHRTIKLSNILLSIYQTKPKKI